VNQPATSCLLLMKPLAERWRLWRRASEAPSTDSLFNSVAFSCLTHICLEVHIEFLIWETFWVPFRLESPQ
jgi:hypothetical protein